MLKIAGLVSALGLCFLMLFTQPSSAALLPNCKDVKAAFVKHALPLQDTAVPVDVMDVVGAAINSLTKFDIQAVAELYTPNAVIADDEAPYSWNGPTAGIQWVNAVEKACKTTGVTKLKGNIEPVNVFQQSSGNVYVVVPVTFTGNLPGKDRFSVRGAFTFILRLTNGKWLIKSQTWLQQKGLPPQ